MASRCPLSRCATASHSKSAQTPKFPTQEHLAMTAPWRESAQESCGAREPSRMYHSLARARSPSCGGRRRAAAAACEHKGALWLPASLKAHAVQQLSLDA